MDDNIDLQVVEGFGKEWSEFDQSGVSLEELERIFHEYFSIFPFSMLPEDAKGFDLGSGSGRWAQFVAPRVGELHCVEPSAAIEVSKKKLSKVNNCKFHQAGVSNIPLKDGSMDFAYSLGVLHHIPDTAEGIKSCVKKLKIGAPMLLYLYYSFDDKPWWFKTLWRISNVLRMLVCRLPYRQKYIVCQLLAACVYFPLAKLTQLANKFGIKANNFPLSAYADKSFYTMRTDALDRF